MISPRAVKLILLAIALLSIALSLFVFRRKRKEIVLALFAVLLSLVAIEIVLKTLVPVVSEHNEMFAPDPELAWVFVPDKRGAIVFDGESRVFI